jgi:signal transduction histidine kinase/ligand-binding sensor domain-containing protein
MGIFAAAQAPALYFRHLQTANGLSHNKVNCILRDREGFVWVGTDDGLNRYDGLQCKVFRNSDMTASVIAGNIIRDLYEDADGLIWIATADGGLNCYNRKAAARQTFTNYTESSGSIPVNSINKILADDRGHLWLGTSGHDLLMMKLDDKSFRQVGPVLHGSILSLYKDKKGMIWAGREGRSYMVINPSTLEVFTDDRYHDLYARLPHQAVTGMTMDTAGNMYLGSWDAALYRLNASGGSETFNASNSAYVSDEITTLVTDRRGRIWIGNKIKGIQLFDPQKKEFFSYRHNTSISRSLISDQVNAIYIDKEGFIWIGTNNGLSFSRIEGNLLQPSLLPHTQNESITVYDILRDGRKLYIGTSKGLFIEQDGRLQHVPLQYKGTPLQVTRIVKQDAVLYIGTDYTLFMMHPGNFSLQVLPGTDTDAVMKKLIDSRIVDIDVNTIGGKKFLITLPYGHYMSYYDFDEKKWYSRTDTVTSLIKKYGLTDFLMRQLIRTGNTYWVATEKQGIGAWTSGTGRKASYINSRTPAANKIGVNSIAAIDADTAGNIWVASYGKGLLRYDTTAKTLDPIPLTNNLTEGVVVDRKQKVWFVSNGSLFRYDPVTRTTDNFEVPDVESTGGLKGRIVSDSSGHLYAMGTNFYLKFHPSQLQKRPSGLKVSFTALKVFDSSYADRLYRDKIELGYRQNQLTISFAAPYFAEGAMPAYEFRMEGTDDPWMKATAANQAYYNNLVPGEYTFHLRVHDGQGWSDIEKKLNIVIHPPFWRRWWFYLLCAVALALILWLAYHYRVQEILRRQEIRNRIAQDLHDNIGSTLSSIGVYSQVAKMSAPGDASPQLHKVLDRISETSGEMVNEMNDIVWAINPANDSMDKMIARMDSFARPLAAAAGIGYVFNGHVRSVVQLSMQKRKNLYLVFKEAFTNALKYAGAKEITVTLEHNNGGLLLTVQDNGSGFTLAGNSRIIKAEKIRGEGNGLQNMQVRAAEMGGTLDINPVMGKGTMVTLWFPIP